jgi:hypothetical protein
MATVITKTVKSSGGDYATLSAALSALAKDLVTADEQLDIVCYNFQDTANIDTTSQGWTTDATRYVRIVANDDHEGKWSTSVYRLVCTDSDALVNASIDHLRLEGLQFAQIRSVSSGAIEGTLHFDAGTESGFQVVEKCIIYCDDAASYVAHGIRIEDSTPTYTIRNSVIYGGSANAASSGIYVQAANAVVALDNCTIDDFGIGIDYNNTNTTITARNTRITGCTTVVDEGGGGNLASGSNYNTTDGSAPTNWGANSVDSTDTPTIDYVLDSGTLTSRDYHLDSASDSGDSAGTDLSGTFTDDIDGDTRTKWSTGADDGVASGDAIVGAVTVGVAVAASAMTYVSSNVTVAASGADYTSINAALAGETANLVTEDRDLQITVAEGYADTTKVSAPASGYTTDATHRVIIQGATKATKAGYESGRARLDTSGGIAFYIRAIDYCTVRDLIFEHTLTSPSQWLVQTSNTLTSGETLFERCIFITDGSLSSGSYQHWHGHASGHTLKFRNCVFLDVHTGSPSGVAWLNTSIIPEYENCIFSGFGYDPFHESADSTKCFKLTNCEIVDCAAVEDNASFAEGSSDYNLVDDDTDWSSIAKTDFGSNSKFDAAVDYEDDSDADWKNWDFSIASANHSGVDAGTTISGLTDDITGTARTGTMDTGPTQFEPPLPPTDIVLPFPQTGTTSLEISSWTDPNDPDLDLQFWYREAGDTQWLLKATWPAGSTGPYLFYDLQPDTLYDIGMSCEDDGGTSEIVWSANQRTAAADNITGAVTVGVAVAASSLMYATNYEFTNPTPTVPVNVTPNSSEVYQQNKLIEGAITVWTGVSADMVVTQNPALTGAVTVGVLPLAAFRQSSHEPAGFIGGYVTVDITPTAGLVYNPRYTFAGSITVAPAINGEFDYTFVRDIDGAITVSVAPAADMAAVRQYMIAGATEVSVVPDSLMLFLNEYELTGAVSVNVVPAAVLAYTPEQAIVGAVTVTVTPHAVLSYRDSGLVDLGWPLMERMNLKFGCGRGGS